MEVWFEDTDIRLDEPFLDKIPLSTYFYKAETSDKDNWWDITQ